MSWSSIFYGFGHWVLQIPFSRFDWIRIIEQGSRQGRSHGFSKRFSAEPMMRWSCGCFIYKVSLFGSFRIHSKCRYALCHVTAVNILSRWKYRNRLPQTEILLFSTFKCKTSKGFLWTVYKSQQLSLSYSCSQTLPAHRYDVIILTVSNIPGL